MRQPIPFGKYYLLERVNVGGMAEVFKAKAIGVEGFERLVAVKRILPSIAEDEEFITMFIDEAKIAVQLTHANVAQIFDLGKVDDSYFIALEYIHGKDLRAIFNRARARGEQLPVPLCCYVIMKLCEGLDYAHNKRDAGGSFLNLVHRDVSPQNILCSYEGEVKIIDFGIAKAAGKAGRTQAGILKGKFGYMSPEQVQGMEIDRRSDVFGVGICLYEMLTGERLFVAESDFATLEKVRNVDIMPPSTYNRRIPEELEQIVLKALARDRNQRHQTAMQLHDELQGFMYGSGNFFGRRDLSMYVHRAFAEEIQRESARDQEYGAAGGATSGEREDVTGLTAFEEIDPVSTVSALHEQPLAAAPRPVSPAQGFRPQQQGRGMAAPVSSPNLGPQGGRPLKSTLLGLPTAPGQPIIRPQTSPGARGGLQVPPLVPRPQSIPPGAQASAPQPRLDMDWDDEEMSTQIYDRQDDGRTVPVSAGPLAAPIISPQASAPISGSFPPALSQPPMQAMPMQPMPMSRPQSAFGAPIGAPSPFAYEPEPQHRERRPSTADVSWPPPGTTQRKPMVLAAVSVVVILALIVVALLFFRTPAPGALHVSTVPPDVSVTVDGMPQPGPSPFVIPSVAPGVPHEVVISKDGYRAWSGKVELQPDQTLALPPVVLELLESGFTLDSVPSGAQVSVDGRPLERRTPVRVTDLTPGDHQIRLESDGYSRWESSLHVTPGTVLDLPTAQLTGRAEGEAGAAVAAAAPAAAPAAPAAPAPPPAAVSTRSAPRRPRSAPSAQTFAPQPVAVAPPSEPEPEPESEPTGGGGTGTLRVQTRPWSKVSVDGRYVGNTPLMGLELSAGRHTLTFINEEFGIRKTVRVQIQAGQIATQVLTLAE